MKRRGLPILVLCFVLMCGCQSEECVPVAHSAAEITRVEFVDHGFGEVLSTVDDQELIAQLVEELRRTPMKRHWNDPPFSYGNYLMALHCADGTVELIGMSAMGVVRDGCQEMDGWHSLNDEVMADLFLRYGRVDIELRDRRYR